MVRFFSILQNILLIAKQKQERQGSLDQPFSACIITANDLYSKNLPQKNVLLAGQCPLTQYPQSDDSTKRIGEYRYDSS
jgi:hypothetical protein